MRVAGRGVALQNGVALDFIADDAGIEREDAAAARVPAQAVVHGLQAWKRRERLPCVFMSHP